MQWRVQTRISVTRRAPGPARAAQQTEGGGEFRVRGTQAHTIQVDLESLARVRVTGTAGQLLEISVWAVLSTIDSDDSDHDAHWHTLISACGPV